MSENEKTGLNNSTYNILSALGRDADFLYDTIDKYILMQKVLINRIW